MSYTTQEHPNRTETLPFSTPRRHPSFRRIDPDDLCFCHPTYDSSSETEDRPPYFVVTDKPSFFVPDFLRRSPVYGRTIQLVQHRVVKKGPTLKRARKGRTPWNCSRFRENLNLLLGARLCRFYGHSTH